MKFIVILFPVLLGNSCQQLQKFWQAPAPAPPWVKKLDHEVRKLLEPKDGQVGIYVRRLSDNSHYGLNEDETFYYASAIKFFVLIEAMMQIKSGRLDPEEIHTLKDSDYRDGAGPTKWLAVGSHLRYKNLIRKMAVYSDNTATDILISKLGVRNINRRVSQLSGGDIGSITSLLAVRKQMYGELHPRAYDLSNLDFRNIRRKFNLIWRLRQFSRRAKADRNFTIEQWDRATERYYSSGLNSGSLRAYAQVLEKVVRGKELGPEISNKILTLMRKCQTGKRRLTKGFPRQVKLAHYKQSVKMLNGFLPVPCKASYPHSTFSLIAYSGREWR